MIECNPDRNFGQPSLKGRRLTVYNIVTKIFYEDDLNVALADYQISLKDAGDAVEYCMTLKCRESQDLLHYCDGCLLRTFAEGWNFNNEDYIEVQKMNDTLTISKDGKEIFLGSVQELENSEFGQTGWLVASDVFNKYQKNFQKNL